ncbi:MAG: pyridoxal phosphate-dependent aminotransferase [Deltaproteobacteria bacterium]|nr:pyridoxal phosphate-dependent aminotransferase [Deltaproteobacteria bacterium]
MPHVPADFLPLGEAARIETQRALSPLALGLEDSMIRHVAAEVWALQAEGQEVCNLTIGDFAPAEFPVPAAFLDRLEQELRSGQTNYTPSDGIPELRRAVVDLYRRELGLEFAPEAVVIGGGARPVMFAVFACFLTAGDGFAYGVPSWNTQYYVYLMGCEHLAIRTQAASRFLPTGAQVAEVLPRARLLILNSPLNPTGTAYRAEELQAVCEAVLAENRRRQSDGRPPVILVYDMVYWTLTGPGQAHVHPLALVPELSPWTVYVDAISKSLSATGLRVGWAVAPLHLKPALKFYVGHTGGFAPRAEQRAAAWYFGQPDILLQDRAVLNRGIRERLAMLVEAMSAWKAAGLPVDFIPPEGGIYLSTRFALHGRTVDGVRLATNEDVRRLLLQKAGVAVVPFQGFGLDEESGWFRMSVGGVGRTSLQRGLERLQALLTSIGS